MNELRSCIVTLTTCLILLLGYALIGPAEDARNLNTLSAAFVGVLRHGDQLHLAGNLLVIFFGGIFAEPRLGPRKLVGLMVACAVLGTVTQFYLIGPRFVGASGISYGLLAYGVMTDRNRAGLAIASAAMLFLLVSELLFLSQTIAVYVHITGAMIGGSFVMFEALFGNKGPALKPMQPTHIGRVVEIINQTDEDDAKEAEENFYEDGLEGMFVLMQKGEVLGVTGYSVDAQVDDIAWLSWTYLDSMQTGQGLGGQMLNDLLGKLKGYGVRKIFMATSDYEDFGKPLYAAAHKMYEDFGATVELTVPDYHALLEAKIVYGLNNPEFSPAPAAPPAEQTGVGITGIAKEPETDGVYGLTWEERPVGLAGLDHAIDKANQKGGRMVVLAVPSDLSDENADALQANAFKRCGQLDDYYSPNIHQVWWSRTLGAT